MNTNKILKKYHLSNNQKEKYLIYKYYATIATVLIFIFFFQGIILSEEPVKQQAGIEEKLGQYIPMNISLYDEYGKAVQLKDIMDKGKPIILTLVYYRCPSICSPLLSGIAEIVDKLDLIAGKDYDIVTISFNPAEDYTLAAEKKKNYYASLKIKKDTPQDAWRFFVSDSSNIARLTDAAGYRYIRTENEFIHPGVIIFLSPDGKITRYLYGIEFLPFDVKMALMEASEGKIGSTVAKIIKLCYAYDPEGKRYALDITRIAGIGIIIFIALFVVILVIKKKPGKKD